MNISHKELFENKAVNSQNLLIKERFMKFASLYETCLKLLVVYNEMKTSNMEINGELFNKLTKVSRHIENIVYWGYTYEGTFFVRDIVHKSFRKSETNNLSVRLDTMSLVSTLKLLEETIDSATASCMKYATYYDEESKSNRKYTTCVELETRTPNYFEWKGNTTSHHLDFFMDLLELWRKFDKKYVDEILNEIKSVKEKVLSLKKKKSEDRKQKENKYLEKVEEEKKKTSDPKPLVKVMIKVPKTEENPWSKEPKPSLLVHQEEKPKKNTKKKTNTTKESESLNNEEKVEIPLSEVGNRVWRKDDGSEEGEWIVQKR